MLDYYHDVWGGSVSCSDEELLRLLNRAEMIIDSRIYLSGFSVRNVPEFFAEPINNAVCAQADYIFSCGGLDEFGSDDSVNSVNLGDFSYSGGISGIHAKKKTLSPVASLFLESCGLLYRGGVVSL